MAYITNSNFWNCYYIRDLITKQIVKIGCFEPDRARLFGVFGCISLNEYFITTGSSYAINEQDFAHVRISKISQGGTLLETKAIKLIELGNM